MANPAIIVEFLAETSKLVAGVKDVQQSGDKANSALGKINFKSVAKWTAVAAAAAGTAKLLKDSSEQTIDLAKATAQLTRATNLDAKTASAWVETLKVRNISVDSFQTSLVKTAKLMDKYRLAELEAVKTAKDYNDAAARLEPIIAKGGDAGKAATKELNKWGDAADAAAKKAGTAAKPFERLGINLADVKAGRISKVILEAADGFAKIKNPATRAALAVQLFGRQGLKLLPLLMKGSKGIEEQLKLADKYGATLSEKTVKAVGDLAEKQRELKLAQDGVKNSIGQALLPAQVSLYGSLLQVVQVILPLTKNVEVMKGVLIAAAVAWVAYKVAVIASTIASLGLNAAMLPQIAIAAAIVIGIAALIAIGVLLYKNWDKLGKLAGTVWAGIKKGAQATLDWLKRNWPYILGILTGPFGLAVAAIYKNWGAISGAIQDGFNAVKQAINAGKAAVIGWGSNVADWIKSGIVGTLGGIGSAAWNVVNNIGAVIVQYAGRIKGWGTTIADGIKAGFSASISGLAAIFKSALNAIIGLWNKLEIPGFKIKGPGPLPDIKFPAIKFPNIPLLAKGGIVTGPTLAMLGERGPEAVVPLGSGGAPIEVRVFIGDQELRGMVSTEVRDQNNRIARTLLAGRIA